MLLLDGHAHSCLLGIPGLNFTVAAQVKPHMSNDESKIRREELALSFSLNPQTVNPEHLCSAVIFVAALQECC